MSKWTLFGAALAGCLLAQGASAITWSVSSFTLTDLGRDPNFGGNYDVLTGDAQTGNATTLPASVLAHNLTFFSGANRWDDGLFNYTLTRNVTIGSVTLPVSQSLTVKISAADSIWIDPSAPVLFDQGNGEQYLFTAGGWSAENVGAETHGEMAATIEAVPEPFTLALGVSALSLAIARRRRAR